jgi:WD40 repeat protein
MSFNNSLSGHSDKVNSVNFSPDALMLASGSDDKNIIIWSIINMK